MTLFLQNSYLITDLSPFAGKSSKASTRSAGEIVVEGYFIFFLGLLEEAYVTEQLTPLTPVLGVRGSSLARPVVFLDKELYSTLSLFTQVYKWVLATYCWGVTL